MFHRGIRKYGNVLDIPEGRSGPVKIRHVVQPAGWETSTANMRTRMYGQNASKVRFDHETRWHHLEEKGHGLWMTDLPIEQRQHDELVMTARGNVLVGGLGLGYALLALSTRKHVRSITVVERSQHIINLVQPHIKTVRDVPIHVIKDDLFDYLTTTPARYDWAFYDIWQADSEGTFHEMIVPLRRLSHGKVKKVLCWNEDVMRGQLAWGITSRLMQLKAAAVDPKFNECLVGGGVTLEKLTARRPDDEPGAYFANWAVPFWEWVVRNPDVEDEVKLNVSQMYVELYGYPEHRALLEKLLTRV